MKGKFVAYQQLSHFSNLPVGWDYGEGIPILPQVYFQANVYIRLIHFGVHKCPDIWVTVHPKTDGGVTLTCYKQGEDNFIDISINPDLSVDLRHEKGIGADYTVVNEKENIDYHYFLAQLRTQL